LLAAAVTASSLKAGRVESEPLVERAAGTPPSSRQMGNAAAAVPPLHAVRSVPLGRHQARRYPLAALAPAAGGGGALLHARRMTLRSISAKVAWICRKARPIGVVVSKAGLQGPAAVAAYLQLVHEPDQLAGEPPQAVVGSSTTSNIAAAAIEIAAARRCRAAMYLATAREGAAAGFVGKGPPRTCATRCSLRPARRPQGPQAPAARCRPRAGARAPPRSKQS
jgi:hypothetical protein